MPTSPFRRALALSVVIHVIAFLICWLMLRTVRVDDPDEHALVLAVYPIMVIMTAIYRVVLEHSSKFYSRTT